MFSLTSVCSILIKYIAKQFFCGENKLMYLMYNKAHDNYLMKEIFGDGG